MPGGKGFVDSPSWFQDKFGFKEESYAATKRNFDFADGVLTSKINGASFHIGAFETPSVSELYTRIPALDTFEDRLSFENITGSAKTLILNESYAGAVFQVASQFNCLEMNEPGARPEDGVTRYYCDATQGPACALACPAGTVFRNYFAGEGRGQGGKGNQIDCLADVGELLQNSKERLWKMTNGYCMPDSSGGVAKASERLARDPALLERARAALRVGVHWDTEVKTGTHRVCQVFASALPVAYAKSVRSKDWEPFACAVLDGAYEGTLAAATVLALQRQQRVTVLLTAVGGGAFGNRTLWIVQAMERALKLFERAPLDVKLVHFGSVPRSTYQGLEKGRRPIAGAAAKLPSAPAAVEAAADAAAEPEGEAGAPDEDVKAKVQRVFETLDDNGDGVIDVEEMTRVLMALVPSLSPSDARRIFAEADSDSNGEVHYGELLEWIFAGGAEALSVRNIELPQPS